MTRQIRSRLEDVVTRGSLLPEGDSTRWRTGPGEAWKPAAVVAPSSEEEMAAVMALASQEGWTVLPAGSGSWLEGGGPTEVSLVVTTSRMKGIHEYEPADVTFTAGAGISLDALQGNTEPHGQWLPLDPPGSHGGTLGAVMALGLGGPLRHLYGTPRDHVLGLTMVSGDGRVLRWGGKVVKNVAGFDVTRLTVGSWGCLGVITSVSARLFPIPERDRTLIVRGPAAQELLAIGRAAACSPLPLAAVELLDPIPTEDGGPGSDASGPEAPTPGLVLRLLGSQAQVEETEARIVSDLVGGGAPIRLEGEESRRFHRILNGWEEGADLVCRLALLPSELGTLLDEGGALRAFLSGEGGVGSGNARLSAQMGTGILRLAVSGLGGDGATLSLWASTLRELRTRLEEKGGTLTLSYGPPDLVLELGAWGEDEATLALMKGLKEQFDPRGTLAPGRLGL